MKVILSALAVVAIAGSARAGICFGDDLIQRKFASDYPVGVGGTAPIFVVPSAVLPNGTLNGFETWDQVERGSSPFSSAGNVLTAYVLRPTGMLNAFKAVFVSDLLTIPVVASSQIVTFQVSPFQTLAGDRIAFHGQGVPLDWHLVDGVGFYTKTDWNWVLTAPSLNQTFILGSDDFPLYSSDRNYSFAADITPVPEPTTMIAGALALLPFGPSILRIMRKRRTA